MLWSFSRAIRRFRQITLFVFHELWITISTFASLTTRWNNVFKKNEIVQTNSWWYQTWNHFLFLHMIECTSTSIYSQKKLMKFLNVNYVFDFMINIVANNILANKKLHFDTTHNYLHKNDILIVFVSRINAHYVFENNKFEKINVFVVIVRKKFISK